MLEKSYHPNNHFIYQLTSIMNLKLDP